MSYGIVGVPYDVFMVSFHPQCVGNTTNILQDNEASVTSAVISIDIINIDRGLSVDDRKIKTNEIYLRAQWNDEDKYEVKN